MKYVDIMFGPYLPDLGGAPNPQMPGYLVDAYAVRPTQNGYRGQPSFANVGSATQIGSSTINYARGAVFVRDSTAHTFVATSNSEIYESRAEGTDTWQDVSPTSGTDPYALGDFVRFSDDVVFVSQTRVPIVKDLSTSHATAFADLAGSPPLAVSGARVRQHLVLAGLPSVDYYAVQTSAIGDHEDFPTPGSADARSKQAIRESLNPEFGFVRKVIGGEKIGIVMQENALTRMTYVGGTTVYEFDTFDRTEGIGKSLFAEPVTDGRFWYWYNEAGMFVTDGYTARTISDGKIDEALFFNTISHPNGSNVRSAFTSVYDYRRGQVIFGGPSNVGGARTQLVYNVMTDSFSLMFEPDETCMFVGHFESATPALGGKQIYNVNFSNRRLQKLSAATGQFALQTGYIELEPGHRVQIQGAHPLGANLPTSLTLSYKAAETLDDIDVLQSGFSAFTAANRGLKYTARADAPFFSFRLTGTGSESHLYRGIRIFYEKGSQL